MQSALPWITRALRATLFGLHVCAVFAGTECVVIWAAFRWTPAAIVGGLAYVVGGVLALLAYPRTFTRTRRVILARGLRVYVYAMALMIVGALLVREGANRAVVGRIHAAGAQAELAADEGVAGDSSAAAWSSHRDGSRRTGERAPGPTASRGRVYRAQRAGRLLSPTAAGCLF